MGVTINVNNLSLVHKGSNGLSAATIPDVCKTPPTPVPVPYPNISFSRDLAKGTKTITADGGNMIAIKGSEFSRSIGDEPGVAGGVKSGVNMKESTWITYSFDVKMDGKNACRLTDKKFQNHANTVDAAGEMQMFIPGDELLNILCNIFCEIRERGHKSKAARFNYSDEAKKLAKSRKYSGHLKKFGLVSEKSFLVRVGKHLSAGRKIYSEKAVMDRLKRKARQEALERAGLSGARAVAKKGAKKVIAKFIPYINVASLVLDIYEGYQLAADAANLLAEARKGYDIIKVKPDIAQLAADGSVKEAYDFKFYYPGGGKDSFQNNQDKIYKEMTGKNPNKVDLETCNNCKTK